MNVFKKIDTQDFYLTDYVARKSWRLLGEEVQGQGVEVLVGESGSTLPLYPSSNRDPGIVWKSTESNYYKTGEGEKESPFLWDSCIQGERVLSSSFCNISIPRTLYGIYLQPGSLEFSPLVSGSSILYVEDEYWGEGYAVSSSISGSYLDYVVRDDGKGHMVNLSGSVVGDAIYNQGQVFLQDPILAEYYKNNSSSLELKWKSNLPIYTLNVNCRIRNTEMNYTLNPSAGELSTGEIHENITGEEFSPYITTVGLYNDRNELLMVGKMNRPVRKSKDMDMVFKINLDI